MLLIICKSKRLATARADLYRRTGLLTYGASASEAFNELNLNCHAVLIISPELLIDPHDYVRRLKSYSPAPIFGLYSDDSLQPYSSIFDDTFKFGDSIFDTVTRMAALAKERGLSYIGEYANAGFDANIYEYTVSYFNKHMYLSKTQRRVLALLINIYPDFASTRTIVKYVYHPSRCPEPTAMRTHIHAINGIFLERLGHDAVLNIPGKGYVLRTPEAMRRYNLSPSARELEQQDKHSYIPF